MSTLYRSSTSSAGIIPWTLNLATRMLACSLNMPEPLLHTTGIFVFAQVQAVENSVGKTLCPIRPTAAGNAVCPSWPDHVYHWHREGFELPHGAELLAEGDDFPVQAFQSGHAFGFQFHPDVTYAMMHRWTTRGDARLELPGARARHHHFADRAVHDATERAWLKQFLDGWLARVPRSVMSEAAE